MKRFLRTILPEGIFSAYHRVLASLGAFLYFFPSRKIIVIGVTGTKGKTSVTELLSAIFEEAGFRSALLNSIRIKTASQSEPNPSGRSMPGRFFIQRFLHRALSENCTVAILEMTSEGARQHRHRGIAIDCLVFTNLAPEHIESHGSYEAYADAKFEIGRALLTSPKRPRTIVANSEDRESARYLTLPVEHIFPFALSSAAPHGASDHGGFFTMEGTRIDVPLPGEFSLKNALAAATVARAFGISLPTIKSGLAKVRRIPGRAERIEEGQDFLVVVDYAHTPDSLQALYDAYASRRKICVVSATGGGRDTWKRPAMGKIADAACDAVILTDEDPYDEDPRDIVEDIARGMARKPEIIMDRRAAISRALEIALRWSKGGNPFDKARGNQNGIAVLITGKGTDAFIHGPHGTNMPWDDATVAREELKRRRAL